MSNFWFVTGSNKPRLRDPTKVKRIMARYWFDFDCDVEIEREVQGQHRLVIEGDGWPGAWLLPPGVSPNDYFPDFDTSGEGEFRAFLTEISDFLLEPLIIQAIGTATGQFPLSACEWHVEPTSGAVTVTEFTSPADTDDIVCPALACA